MKYLYLLYSICCNIKTLLHILYICPLCVMLHQEEKHSMLQQLLFSMIAAESIPSCSISGNTCTFRQMSPMIDLFKNNLYFDSLNSRERTGNQVDSPWTWKLKFTLSLIAMDTQPARGHVEQTFSSNLSLQVHKNNLILQYTTSLSF